jgi:hypothetical protein
MSRRSTYRHLEVDSTEVTILAILNLNTKLRSNKKQELPEMI